MNVLDRSIQKQAISALVEGASIRSTERMTGAHRDTIMRLLCRTGDHCGIIMAERLRNLSCESLQLDEIWTFVWRKAHTHRKLVRDGAYNDPKVGDQFVFVALDADSKLVPCFHVGKRNGANALTFMSKLQERVRKPVQITTDAFNGYPWAIGNSYGRGTHFARINKIYQTRQPGRGRYSPPWFVTVKKQVMWGNPRESRISTSYVERQNLTMRMQMRRFTRLTNAFSKKYDNLLAALNLHFCWYNFVRIHSSLKTTPAVAAGVETRPWKIEELIPTNGNNGSGASLTQSVL